MAALAHADAVLRRRRRRRPGGGARRRNWRCRCWRRTAPCVSPRCPAARIPTRWSAARAADAFQAVLDGRRAAGRCALSTCCARRAARPRRSSARRFLARLEAAAGESPTRRWPANTARRCWTGSSPAPTAAAGATAPAAGAPAPCACRSARAASGRGSGHGAGPHPDRNPAAPPRSVHDVEHAYAGLDLPRPLARVARSHSRRGRKRPKSLTLAA